MSELFINEKMVADSNLIKDLLAKVDIEIWKASWKYGLQNSLHESYGILAEEVDEFWEQVKLKPCKKKKWWQSKKVRSETNIEEELIQIAATAIKALHDMKLRNKEKF